MRVTDGLSKAGFCDIVCEFPLGRCRVGDRIGGKETAVGGHHFGALSPRRAGGKSGGEGRVPSSFRCSPSNVADSKKFNISRCATASYAFADSRLVASESMSA
jgi:hypothetical protein